jgi:catalase
MDGFGVHAYKLINAKGDVHYVKFNWKSRQGIKNLSAQEAAEIQGQDFSHATRDMYSAIAKSDFPQWDLYIQVLKPSQLDDFDYNPLDPTKIWLNLEEQKIGTMTLNRVPDNFFQETEQAAFAPANIVPGIEPSEDRLLQGRVFSYADTQMYRLGPNHQQLPINRPRAAVSNWNQDGAGNYGNQKSEVNYQPSRRDTRSEDRNGRYSSQPLHGSTQQQAIHKQLPFAQAGVLYRGFSAQEKQNLIANLAGDLSQVRDSETKHIMLSHFYRADNDFGERLTHAVKGDLKKVKALLTR